MLRLVRWYINYRSEVTDIVKDVLKNPYNVIYVIFDGFFSFNVYICLILGAKHKNWCAEKSEHYKYICFNFFIHKNKLKSYKTLQLSQ